MRVVILAGGKGTRLAEETGTRPKPMVEIGGHPILWHVMQLYAAHGHKDFLVATGYKGEMIKSFFHTYAVWNSDFQVDFARGTTEILASPKLDWRVSIVDTGLDTMTGGRIRRLRPYLEGTFMVTYGDGLGSIDIAALIAFHRAQGRLATVTAVRPPARFGDLLLAGDRVEAFVEKPQTGEGWINGGFFVFEPAIFELLGGDDVSLEKEPLERLAAAGQLSAYRHAGFWQPMDTLREKQLLEDLWASGRAPWLAAP